MDFLMVDNDRLKVTLSPDDVEALAFQGDFEVGDANPKARFAFRTILGKAQAKTGFDVGSAKLLVQCFPSKDGGCELFITKLSKGDKELSSTPYKKRTDMCELSRIALAKKALRRYIFKSPSFNLLCEACKFLCGTSVTFLSAVYYDDSCGYCLILTLPPAHTHLQGYEKMLSDKLTLSRLTEFGSFSPLSNDSLLYIKEHCSLITGKDAVKMLSKFTK